MITRRDKKRQFGYDAATGGTRRRARPVEMGSEDKILPRQRRRQVVATARDASRNFALVRWAVNKHLDYVTSFNFQSRNGIPALDARIEELMTWWQRPNNCDIAGRHSLPRMLRILEARRTLDGDVFVLKMRVGKVQGVEGDRVAVPQEGLPKATPEGQELVQGVYVNNWLRAISFVLCQRNTNGGLVFEREIPARNILHHGYWDRLDQVRGISPFVPALNTLSDTYEGFDLALAKMKLAQLCGIAFFRSAAESAGNLTGTDTDEDSVPDSDFTVDFGKGPIQFDLDGDDRAEFLESKSPPLEFQSWSQAMLMLVLKALDIPYSFYDEKHTNYSGQRQAWLQYDQSADAKRNDNRWLLDNLTAWKLRLWALDGTLQLPAGLAVQNLKWEWISRGIPWMQPLQEIKADETAIKNFLSSRSRIYKQRTGGDWDTEVAEELARENEVLEHLNLIGGKAIAVPK